MVQFLSGIGLRLFGEAEDYRSGYARTRRWVQEMLITSAIHAIPEWLVVLIAGKSGRCKVRKGRTELRVRKSICKINQQLFDHRLHLGGGLE
ncbi:MAG: hypothetical protein DMG97_16085 [Acidobacteria bacterium]|nr:MAG: hypothetical protein DMG97_16085 [Acidobacteriota bacterium]